MIGRTISHYTVLEKLGEGGMGVVYKATDTKLGRTVALKFLPDRVISNPSQKERFLQEAKSASALNHPNICTIYYLEEVGTETFIVMEYVDGSTLRDRLPVKNVQEVVNYAVQIGEALHEAHGRGIVHRDIKADNIMLNSRSQVKVMDFGLAKIKGSIKLTRSSSTVGTLAYMAPEQVRGEEVDPRSDIFSFGVLLFEMLAGVIPFKGEHEAAVMYSLLNEAPEPMTKYRQDVPAMLVNLIERCIEKDPADRYQHADDLVSELRRIQKQSTRVSRPSMSSMDTAPAASTSFSTSTSGVIPTFPGGPSSSGVSSPGIPVPGISAPGGSAAGIPSAGTPIASAPTGGRRSRLRLMGAGAGLLILAALGYFLVDFGGGGDGGAGQTERKMLVVLPFENLGSGGEEYFADGITEEITAKLSGISGLGVIASSSARQYKGANKTVREIGDELNVGYVLQGTIRWSPADGKESKVRVSPALIRIDDGTQVWSQSFSAVVSDVFTMQSDIASQVAGAMGVSLLAPEKEIIGKRPTDNDEAYDLYLRGNEYYRRSYRKEDIEIGIDMYTQAVEKDPGFALAWARLSESHAAMYWHHHDHVQRRIDLAKAAVDRALALDPLLPEAHMSLGYYYYWGRLDYENGLKELYVALKGKPNDGHLLLGIGAIQRRQGKMKEAAASMMKAIEVDPRRAEYLFNAAQTYGLLREHDKAIDLSERAISLSPDILMQYITLGENHVSRDGSTMKARQAIERAARLAEYGTPASVFLRVCLDMYDGKFRDALALASERFTAPRDDQFVYIPRPLLIAEIHSCLGDQRRAASYYDSARVELEKKIADDPMDGRFRSALGIALAGLGKKDEAIASGRKGMELMTVEQEAWRGSARLIDMSRIYAMTGEREKAVELLRKLLAMPADIDKTILKVDPAWRGLKDYPAFKELIAAN